MILRMCHKSMDTIVRVTVSLFLLRFSKTDKILRILMELFKQVFRACAVKKKKEKLCRLNV